MNDIYIKCKHHGAFVSVRSDLKGEHSNYCLCNKCEKFYPANRKQNCSKANKLYSFCVKNDTVLVIWECPNFVSIVG